MNNSIKLIDFGSLPEWNKDNEHIKSGYRKPNASYLYCIRSVFVVHTETGNILTHMIGCVLFIVLAVYMFNCQLYSFNLLDKLVFGAFFCGIITCLSISALFHTFMCHSKPTYKIFAKLDYCGISLLITLSFVPWIYYGFYFTIAPRITYLTLTITLGIICIIISVCEKFSEPKYRSFRAILFVVDGLCGLIPGIHWLILYKCYLYDSAVVKAFILLTIMGALYIIGAVCYMTQFPERFFPGKLDIWFNSHQIFHLFVIVAAVIYCHSLQHLASSRITHLMRNQTHTIFDEVIEQESVHPIDKN